MALAAQRTARLLNQADLSRDAGLSLATCHRYINLLETGCLITRLQPYTGNATTALVKTPKLFWSDCGLAAWLAGIRNRDQLKARLDTGFCLEQTLFQTLQAWRMLDPARRRLYFWRDRPGREVDFVLELDGKLVALEVKESRQATSSDADGIRAFRQSLKRSSALVRGVVLHGGEPRSLDTGISALPWSWLVPRAI